MDLSNFDQFLWFASTVLATAVIVRVIYERLLLMPYTAFVGMLGIIVVRDVVLAVLHYDSHPYVLVWKWSLPVLLFGQMYAGWQTLKAVSKLYPKMGKFVLRVFLLCSLLTVLGCCVGLPFELRRISGQEAVLRILFFGQRWIASWIAGTLILVALYLIWSPAPDKQPPRNLVIHTAFLSFYFGGYGFLFFIENLAPLGAAVLFERIQFSLVVFLYAAWAVCLSAKGQKSDIWPEMDVLLLRKIEPEPVAGYLG